MMQNNAPDLRPPDGTAPSRKGEARLLAIVMLINLVDGLDNQLLPLSLNAIGSHWGVPPAQFATAVSAGFVGAALGTPLGGWLGDRKGRKPAILTGIVLLAGMTMAMALCRTTGQLTLARLLAGIGLGMSLSPMLALIVEGVAPQRKGIAIALTMLAMPLGLTLSGLIIPRLILMTGWRSTTLLCGASPLAIALLALLFLRDTSTVTGHRTTPKATMTPLVQTRSFLQQIDVARVVALMGALFMTYVAMAAALSWLTPFAIKAGVSPIAGGQALSTWSLAGMAGTLLAGWIANRIGGTRAARRILAAFGITTLAGAMVLLAGDGRPAALYLAAGLGGLFASGAITVLYTASAECFPAHMRATGISAVTLAGKAGGIVGGASGTVMLALPSLPAFFAALGVIALCGRACLFAVRREGMRPVVAAHGAAGARASLSVK